MMKGKQMVRPMLKGDVLVGIDPGLAGGIVFIQDGIILGALDIPTSGEKAKRRVDVSLVFRAFKHWNPQAAFIERAQAMPKQGASSGFNYGRAVGALEAVALCAGVSLTIVEPAVWKRALGLIGREKEDSRQKAIKLYPKYSHLFERKKDHGRAEAALIVYYANEMHKNGTRN